ncbi:MAG: metalloregulator ArsR/SmtB family transcription factor [Gammaproteobacteria bacterium]|nr:metalloregulator ArsR/SmtB family transcription factor [Gammaproteobacteria bacterium]
MLPLTDSAIAEMADILRLMGEPNRLKILIICMSHATTVTTLSESLGLSMPLISHHLRLLRAMRLLHAERHGKQVLYRLEDEHVRCILSDMVAHFTTDCVVETK